MNILLVNPPLFDPIKYGKEILLGSAPALGLGYIGAVLRNEGYDVSILDAYFLSWKEMEAALREKKPDVLGITCLTEGRASAYGLARLAKSLDPTVKTVMGGHHAAYLCEQVLENYPVDIVVRGEGELTFLELVQALENKADLQRVKGIAYRDEGVVVKTSKREFMSDLDRLPVPLYEFFDFDCYPDYRIRMAYRGKPRKKIGRYVSVVTSRGCPGNCLFCSSSRFWGVKWRSRSAESVVDEVEMLYKDYRARYINFADDAFTIEPERVIAICKEILKRKLRIRWDCTTRVNAVSVEMFEWMKAAGCFFVSFGVESGCASVLANINKRITIPDITRAFKLAHKAGLRAVAFLMVGNPGESDVSVDETAALLKAIRPWRTSVSVAMVFPGSALYERAKASGFLNDDFWLTERPPPYFTLENSVDRLHSWKRELDFAALNWSQKPKWFYMYSVRGPAFDSALRVRDLMTEKTGVKITKKGLVLQREGKS